MNIQKKNKSQKNREPGTKKKKKTAILQWIALLAAFLVVIIFVLFDSSKKIMQRAETMVRNSTIQMIGKYSERILSKFHSIQVDGGLLANLIEKGNMTTPQQLQQYLETLCEEEGIIEAVYMDKETVAAGRSGKTDLTQKDYYETVMEFEEATVICIEDEEIAEGKLFLFMIPVAGQEGRIFFYYPAEELKDLINMSAETYRPAASAMADADGSIFVCSDEKNPFFAGGNIWKNISGKSKSEAAKVQNKMRTQGSGRSDLSAGSAEGAIFYVPVGEGTWGLIVEYDQDSIARQERQIWYEAWQMVLRVTGIMILFLLIYMVVNIIARILHEGDNKALEEKADTDQLTGLSNKIATERKIKEYISKHPKELALMFVLDIDNFKKINDTMGHAFGDEVLRTLGKHIGENFRVTDIIGRTGGDEFTIFLKSLKDDSNTLSEAQKLVNFFHGFQAGEYVKYSATASIGAAVFPQDGEDFETLYKAADQALYKAKDRGKNQLAFYDDRDRK